MALKELPFLAQTYQAKRLKDLLNVVEHGGSLQANEALKYDEYQKMKENLGLYQQVIARFTNKFTPEQIMEKFKQKVIRLKVKLHEFTKQHSGIWEKSIERKGEIN